MSISWLGNIMIKLLGSESYISEKNDELSSRNFVGFQFLQKPKLIQVLLC